VALSSFPQYLLYIAWRSRSHASANDRTEHNTVALAIRYREEPDAVLCVLGEGTTNIGYFHESVNLAAVWKLPVVFILMAAYRVHFTPLLLYLPLLVVIETLFLVGLVLLLSCLNVYLRDTQTIVEVLVLAWFLLTPVSTRSSGSTAISASSRSTKGPRRCKVGRDVPHPGTGADLNIDDTQGILALRRFSIRIKGVSLPRRRLPAY
jgi:hypothetical protein